MPSRSHCYARLYLGGIQGQDDDPVTESVRRLFGEILSKHVGSICLDSFELMMENVNNQHEEEVFRVLDLNLELDRITIPGDRIVEGKVRGIGFAIFIAFEGRRIDRKYAASLYEFELIRLGLDLIYQRENAEVTQPEPLAEAAQLNGA